MLNYVDMLSMFLVNCLIYKVVELPVYSVETTLDSLVNEKNLLMNMDWGHEDDESLLRIYRVYPSWPDLGVGYNFGSCLKQFLLRIP